MMNAVAPAASSADTAAPAAGRGRPRREGVEDTVIAAVGALAGEVGLAGLSMDLVAQRAGVSKATIYRRWASKEALMLEVMDRLVEPIPDPRRGDVRADVLAYCTELSVRMGVGPRSDVLPHLIAAACHDEALRASLEDYTRSRRATLRAVLRRGIRNGELAAEFDVDLAVDMLLGTMVYRRLLVGNPLSRGQLEALVARVLAAS